MGGFHEPCTYTIIFYLSPLLCKEIYTIHVRAKQKGSVRLTVYTDYALRLMMYLAVKNNGLATIAEIADSFDISKWPTTLIATSISA